MESRASRRDFLKFAGLGTAALGFGNLPPVALQQATINPKLVKLDSGIEPLVRLMEDTPQPDLLEKVAQKIRTGTTYREVVTALFLAAIRNIQPRPSVGFKFHAVMAMNAAHMASLASPDSDRWLPIFWALDEFKQSQEEERSGSGWRMAPVDESTVPGARSARQAFVDAMDNWDEKKADGAIAALARSAGADEIYELFYRFGARDYRDIGHKAIFVAGSRRLLQFIGWQHAEPVLRSLTFALLHHELKDTTPSRSDEAADRPWRRNLSLAGKIQGSWLGGKLDDGATREMLAALREASDTETCHKAVELIGRGISAQSVWDAVLIEAGELFMRQPTVVMLHAVTSANALRYCFQATQDETTKKLMLLQNCAFLPMFRANIRSNSATITIDDVKPLPPQAPAAPVDEIFDAVSTDKMTAARKVRYFLNNGGSAQELMNVARRLIYLKGNNAHDYKFSVAVLEDYHSASPAWRDTLLSTSVFNLKGTGDRDNVLVQRTRAAFLRTSVP